MAVVGGTALKPDLSVVIDHSWHRLLRWLYLEPLKFVLVARHTSEWHRIFVLWMLVSLQLRHGKRMMRGFIHRLSLKLNLLCLGVSTFRHAWRVERLLNLWLNLEGFVLIIVRGVAYKWSGFQNFSLPNITVTPMFSNLEALRVGAMSFSKNVS